MKLFYRASIAVLIANVACQRFSLPEQSWHLTLEGPSADVGAGSPASLSIFVRDALGWPVAGAALTVTSNRTAAKIEQPRPTDELGRASATVILEEADCLILEAHVVAPESQGSPDAHTTVCFVAPGPPAPAPTEAAPDSMPSEVHSTLSSSGPTSVTEPARPLRAVVQLRDQQNRPLANRSVQWASSIASDRLQPLSASTDALGYAAVELFGTVAGPRTLRVRILGTDQAIAAQVELTPGPVDLQASTLSASPNVVTADGQTASILTLRLLDAFYNGVAGAEASSIWEVPAAGATLQPEGATSDAAGTLRARLMSTRAGPVAVTARVGGSTLGTAVNFVAGPPSASLSSLALSPNVQVADGVQPIVALATFVDAQGNPVVDVSAALSSDGSATNISPRAARTGADGTFLADVTSTRAQRLTLQALAGALTLGQEVQFVAGSPNAATSTWVVDPPSGAPSNGQAVSLLRLTVRDAYNNAVQNARVAFSASGTNTFLSPEDRATSALGSAAVRVRSYVGGPQFVQASVPGGMFRTQVSFVNTAPRCAAGVAFGTLPGRVNHNYSTTHVRLMDVDGDGALDAITTGTQDPTFQVFRGVGDGSFEPSVRYGTLNGARFFLTADLTNDGRTTMLLSSGTNAIQMYVADAQGSFDSGRAVTVSGEVVGLCSADLDGDGFADVVAVSSRSPAGLNVLMNDGAGGLLPASFVSSSGAPMHCVVADLDGDGAQDVAVTNSDTGTIDVYGGTSSAALAAPVSHAVGPSPAMLAVGMLDGDARPDLVVTLGHRSDAAIGVLINQGAGLLGAAQTYRVDPGPRDLVLRDVDGDGQLDAVVATGVGAYADGASGIVDGDPSDSVNIFFGVGDGTWRQPLTRVGGGGSLITADAGDLTGDGHVDLILGMQFSSALAVLPANAPGVFTGPNQHRNQLIPFRIHVADLDGDGRPDVVVSGQFDGLAGVYMNAADGLPARPAPFAPSISNHGMGIADVDGDGHLDILGISRGNTGYSLARGLGDGNFSFQNGSLNASGSLALNQFHLMLGDINGDGAADAVVVRAPGDQQVSVLLSQPSADAATPFVAQIIDIPPGNGLCEGEGALADLNQDGLLDLALPCQNLLILFGDGTGGFGSPTVLSRSGDSISSLAAADIDQDGRLDLVASTAGGAIIYRNTATSGFTVSQTIPYALFGNDGVHTGDVNGDGLVDVIHSDSAGFCVLTNIGSGQFAPERRYGAGIVKDTVFSDIDGDGQMDVVAAVLDVGLVVFRSTGCAAY